jgi:hypothetical protein
MLFSGSQSLGTSYPSKAFYYAWLYRSREGISLEGKYVKGSMLEVLWRQIFSLSSLFKRGPPVIILSSLARNLKDQFSLHLGMSLTGTAPA